MKQLLLILPVFLIFSCDTPKQTVRQAANDAPASLTNTRWVLKTMASAAVPVTGKDIYIQFQPNGAVKGFAGCNGFTGIYVINTKVLTISRLLSTKMWCTQGSVEKQFLKALEEANGFDIAGDQLQLIGKDKTLATFKAEPVKNN